MGDRRSPRCPCAPGQPLAWVSGDFSCGPVCPQWPHVRHCPPSSTGAPAGVPSRMTVLSLWGAGAMNRQRCRRQIAGRPPMPGPCCARNRAPHGWGARWCRAMAALVENRAQRRPPIFLTPLGRKIISPDSSTFPLVRVPARNLAGQLMEQRPRQLQSHGAGWGRPAPGAGGQGAGRPARLADPCSPTRFAGAAVGGGGGSFSSPCSSFRGLCISDPQTRVAEALWASRIKSRSPKDKVAGQLLPVSTCGPCAPAMGSGEQRGSDGSRVQSATCLSSSPPPVASGVHKQDQHGEVWR